LHIGNIITAIDNDVMFVNGTDAARVAASHQVGGGKFWWATDTQLMWYDDGTTWRQLGYAALASPAFTGTPTAPTAATATNTTQIATTAFVKAQNYAATVFGRSGPTITAQAGDYTAAQVTNAADKSSAAIQTFTGEVDATAHGATGLTGATAASRYVGGTAASAPVSGTFAKGDFVVTQTGHLLICTTAGTPGTWTDAGSVSNSVNTVFGRGGAVVAQTGDYTVAQVTGAAPLASPVFTGDPQAPTPAAGDNDTSIATTAFARSLMPAGVILPYGGTAAPNAEWLLCDGTAKSRTTYAALFAAIGTAYGAGDGSTTFNIPNLQGRVPVGKNTGTFATLGATGGEEAHQLTSNELAAHTHTFTGTAMGTHNHTFTGSAMSAHHHDISVGAVPTHSHTVSGTFENHRHHFSYLQTPTFLTYRTDVTMTAGNKALTDIGGFTGASGGITGPIYTGTVDTGASGLSISGTAGPVSAPMPTLTIPDVSAGTPAGTNTAVSAGTPAGTNSPTGNDLAHNNLQPYVVTNYIIKT